MVDHSTVRKGYDTDKSEEEREKVKSIVRGMRGRKCAAALDANQ